ncbi:MAG: glyoxylase-related zinc-dependent hydrolase [Betaproteobacteria bacterium]|nr:glyoxylase-related zinc-dependent hydrolase [Betaproteobacteria bacterium]
MAAPAPAAESTDRFDNFRMREGVPLQLKTVAPDLYFLYDDLSSNSAFLVTDEGVLVIDSRQHPAHGRDLLERIRKITDKPVRWVINTHAHGDHYYGNPAFKAAGATIIAHRDVAAGMIKNEQLEFKRRLAFFKSLNLDPAEVKTVLPDLTFDSRVTLKLGGRIVEIMYLGPGQNPGDTLVYFPHGRALYVGGPFANNNWSNMSFTPSMDGWIALLKKIAAMDNVDLFLPGHGDVGKRQDVLDEADMLAEVQKSVKAAIAAGMSREDLVKNLRFPQFASRRNYDRIDVFLEALYHLYTTGKPLFAYP